MRRRILAAPLVIAAGILAACTDSPTQPTAPSALKASIAIDGCVDTRLTLATIDPVIKGLITNLFAAENHRSSTLTMWENLKKDKLDSRPLQNHIDNLTGWTLEKLSANLLSDPDGAGILNPTTGSVRLLDLVFRCAGETPTKVPTPPAGFDALFQLVTPSATEDQQFNTSFNDAAAFIPEGALDGSTLLVLVRQPATVNVNTPFPKVSNTVDVALAGGKIKPGQNLSVLFCPFETVSPTRYSRLVVAHQRQAVGPSAPVGQGVEYLAGAGGGTLDCPHGVASANPQMEKNALKRSVMHVAALAQKAWNLVGPRTLYAGHAAIGGLISFSEDIGGDPIGDDVTDLSPMVVVDPFVETGIFGVNIPTTTYGEPASFTAQLRVTGVPATCGLATSPAVCDWVGQPVTQSLAGMPELTLANLKITATLDGQSQTDAINADGNAEFTFTGLNAGDDQTASLAFPRTVNLPARAPDFGASTTTSLFTVHRRPLAVTADANEWEYGTPEPVTGTFTSSAVQYGESVTPTYTTALGALTEVDVYPDALVADVVFGAGVRPENYIVTKTNATLTIVKAPLDISANDKTREYGLANPTFDGNIVGIKNGDVITLSFATVATQSSDISTPSNTYAITPTAAGDRLARNYFIRSVDEGVLTITPAPLTISINNAARQYGDANPAFTHDPFVTRNSDVLSVALSTTAGTLSPVGSYDITGIVSGAEVGNYLVTIPPGTLSVSARTISITANDATRDEGAANPTFTGVIGGSGLVGGDGVTVDYVSPATPASPPGPHPINAVLNGAASTNYNATITPGTLTVVATAPILDQSNDSVDVGVTAGCGGTGSMYQSFTPSTGTLKAVELRFRAGGSFPPEGVTTTINIRSGSPAGAIVGTATATVTGLTTGQNALARFTFASPLAVNAGGTYVIEWITTSGTLLTWAVGDDNYAGGQLFGCSPTPVAIPEQDAFFKTYR